MIGRSLEEASAGVLDAGKWPRKRVVSDLHKGREPLPTSGFVAGELKPLRTPPLTSHHSPILPAFRKEVILDSTSLNLSPLYDYVRIQGIEVATSVTDSPRGLIEVYPNKPSLRLSGRIYK